MHKTYILDKERKAYERQLDVARVVLFIFTALFAIEASRNLVEAQYIGWGVGVEYVYLKISVLTLNLTVLGFSFINKYFRSFLLRVSFLFIFSLFYTVVLSIHIEGVHHLDEFYLMALCILVYFMYYEFKEIFFYVVITNTSLLILYLFPKEGFAGIGYEWVFYFILTVGLSILKYFEYKDDQEVLNADELYQQAFNSIKESVVLLNPKSYQIEFYNNTADLMFDIAKAEYKTIRELVADDSNKILDEALKAISEKEEVWEGEMNMIDKKGEEFVSKTTIALLKQESKNLIFLKCLDITRSKYAEVKLKETLDNLKTNNLELEQTKLAVLNVLEDINIEKVKVFSNEQRLQAVLQSIAEGVVVINSDKKIDMYNNTFLRLMLYTKGDVEGLPYNQVLKVLYNIGANGSIENDIEEVFKTGKPISRFDSSQLVRKNGEVLDVNETFSPIIENRKVIRVVAVFRDATEQRKIERMRSEFISIASHQLRTPLTAISWYLEMLMDEKTIVNLTDEQKGYLNMVSESNKKMIFLVNELLDISRIEGGKELELIKEKGDILELINNVIDEQKGLITQKDLKVNMDTQEQSSIMVDMDSEKIRQVIMNLINNAIKYSKLEGTIDVKIRTNQEKVFITVSDNGIGIPKDQQSRVFEKFFRADNALKVHAQGTGLGLYVAKEIIKNHGGTLEFISEQDKGTAFTCTLPLT